MVQGSAPADEGHTEGLAVCEDGNSLIIIKVTIDPVQRHLYGPELLIIGRGKKGSFPMKFGHHDRVRRIPSRDDRTCTTQAYTSTGRTVGIDVISSIYSPGSTKCGLLDDMQGRKIFKDYKI